MILLCAALGNGKHSVPFGGVSAAETAVGKQKENKTAIFMQCWDNEGVLDVILVEDICFDYFTVKPKKFNINQRDVVFPG